MQLVVCQNHEGEGRFPTFSKGTVVENLAPCSNYPNWFSCKIEGMETYVSTDFLEGKTLNRAYNPTELVVQAGDVVELLEVHYQWALVAYRGEVGWLPFEILCSPIVQ